MARIVGRQWIGFLSSASSASLASLLPSQQMSHSRSRFLNIFSIFSKEAVEKERLRLKDELNRGYFDDIKEFKNHSGKLAVASQNLLPIADAPKFPSLLVQLINGEKLTLPLENKFTRKDENLNIPHATLVCITFRANAQAMLKSWSVPFLDTYRGETRLQLYEVSFIDSWILSLRPVRWALLQAMRSSEVKKDEDQLKRVVYAFGDSYDFRKALQITTLLSGYVFLLDQHGRIRWRAWGHSTKDELLSMLSCTSKLLEENAMILE